MTRHTLRPYSRHQAGAVWHACGNGSDDDDQGHHGACTAPFRTAPAVSASSWRHDRRALEVQSGAVTATDASKAMADSAGNVLGLRITSWRLLSARREHLQSASIDLVATDGQILQMPVHFGQRSSRADSREGTTPKTRLTLCAGPRLSGQPNADKNGGAERRRGRARVRRLNNDYCWLLAAGRGLGLAAGANGPNSASNAARSSTTDAGSNACSNVVSRRVTSTR